MKSGPHDQSLFASARQLCADHDGDMETVKALLYAQGVDPQTSRRVLHQMRMEGFLVRARAELTPKQRFMRDAVAGILHLVDLKRAGHSPRSTELPIAPDGHLSALSLRTRRLRPDCSLVGSPAASCAEIGE